MLHLARCYKSTAARRTARNQPIAMARPNQPTQSTSEHSTLPRAIIDQYAITAPGAVITPKIGISENVIPERVKIARLMTPAMQTRTVRIVVSA